MIFVSFDDNEQAHLLNRSTLMRPKLVKQILNLTLSFIQLISELFNLFAVFLNESMVLPNLLSDC